MNILERVFWPLVLAGRAFNSGYSGVVAIIFGAVALVSLAVTALFRSPAIPITYNISMYLFGLLIIWAVMKGRRWSLPDNVEFPLIVASATLLGPIPVVIYKVVAGIIGG